MIIGLGSETPLQFTSARNAIIISESVRVISPGEGTHAHFSLPQCRHLLRGCTQGPFLPAFQKPENFIGVQIFRISGISEIGMREERDRGVSYG